MKSSIPSFMYGTAWKENETRRLTSLALRSGFRAIDTANQRKHYFEEAVGEGIQDFLDESKTTRSSLFLQTKFTYQRGQDHRLPYDPKASLTDQVQQSFESSLKHLRTNFLDSYVLHGPSRSDVLAEEDWEVWSAMEKLFEAQQIRFLGVSNISFEQLESLYASARIKPHFVQNRCFAINGWDQDVRTLCQNHQSLYQGFSLLTANSRFLQTRTMQEISQRHRATIAQIVFAFASQIGMLALTGTTQETHMREDLESLKIQLDSNELDKIETIAL